MQSGAANTHADAFRANFPVFEQVAYLNAGTDGPIPYQASEAAAAEVRAELESGRAGVDFRRRLEHMGTELRERGAKLLGTSSRQVALTRSTTDGVNTIVGALDLTPDDEVLTSDEEHPGVLAPLGSARQRQGFGVRVGRFDDLASSVTERTRLIACSHVSWISGSVVDFEALAQTNVPVLLDGAQALGAVPVDVGALGCSFYAASGQKWLCGPDGSGFLYVAEPYVTGLVPPWPSYASLEDPTDALELTCHADARRFDTQPPAGPGAAWALASLDVLESAGWEWVLRRGPELAGRLCELLTDAGYAVTPRGESTLVSWRSPDAQAAVADLYKAGIVVRAIPGSELLRASVGAWSSFDELERLVAAL